MVTPGQLIAEHLARIGMSQSALARKLKIHRDILGTIVRDKRRLTPLMALRLEDATGISAELLKAAQRALDAPKAETPESEQRLYAPLR